MNVLVPLFSLLISVSALAGDETTELPETPTSKLTIYCPNSNVADVVQRILLTDLRNHPGARYFYAYSSISRGDGSAQNSRTILNFESGTGCIIGHEQSKQ